MIIAIKTHSIEISLDHHKENGEWIIINDKEGDTIELKSINFSFAIEQAYRGLVLAPE